MEGENPWERHCHSDHLEEPGIYPDGDCLSEEATSSAARSILIILRGGAAGAGPEATATGRAGGWDAFRKTERAVPVRPCLFGPREWPDVVAENRARRGAARGPSSGPWLLFAFADHGRNECLRLFWIARAALLRSERQPEMGEGS